MIDDVLIELAAQELSTALQAQLSAFLRHATRFRTRSAAPSEEAPPLKIDPAVLDGLIRRIQEDLGRDGRIPQLPDQQAINMLVNGLDDQTIVEAAKQIADNPTAEKTIEEASQQLRRAGVPRMRPRTVLAGILLWLAAIGGPVAAVEAPASAQEILAGEYATVGTALAITWRVLDQSRDTEGSSHIDDHHQTEEDDHDEADDN
jgi:hypothetical protein